MDKSDAEFLEQLKTEHPLLNDQKFERRMQRMERMKKFYSEKAEADGVPEAQKYMFTGFVNSLQYAITIMHQYRSVTRKLNGQEEDSENVASV